MPKLVQYWDNKRQLIGAKLQETFPERLWRLSKTLWRWLWLRPNLDLTPVRSPQPVITESSKLTSKLTGERLKGEVRKRKSRSSLTQSTTYSWPNASTIHQTFGHGRSTKRERTNAISKTRVIEIDGTAMTVPRKDL